MNQQNTCSVIIIAKNEAARILACIEHVRFAYEIIVVDNGSTDETVQRAKKANAVVVEKPGAYFSALRDAGAKAATGEWLLYVDADEIITDALQKEIVEKIRDGEAAAYYILRTNYYLGHRWPTKDKMVRLIKKSALVSWEGKLHEHAVIQGAIGTLKEPLEHNTHRTIEEMVKKTNEWSDIEAELRLSAGHPKMSWWRFIRVMGTAFTNSFFSQGGWKAGAAGWIESMYQAFSMFITYAKLWEKQEAKQLKK